MATDRAEVVKRLWERIAKLSVLEGLADWPLYQSKDAELDREIIDLLEAKPQWDEARAREVLAPHVIDFRGARIVKEENALAAMRRIWEETEGK